VKRKLTEEQIERIQKTPRFRGMFNRLSEETGVSVFTVRRIWNRANAMHQMVCECGRPAAVPDGNSWACERCHRVDRERLRYEKLYLEPRMIRERLEALRALDVQ
jgi:hypothetical protein